MTIKFLTIVSLSIVAFSNLSYAGCDDGGLQKALRDSANALHPRGNPVKYIDFANDAKFSYALDEMKDVGVPNDKVQTAWAKSVKTLCKEKAARITPADVGPNQTLSGLENLLGVKSSTLAQ